MKVSINGHICGPGEGKISVFDRGLLYGDSIYETLITFDGRPFRWERHLARLHLGAQALMMPLSLSDGQIQLAVEGLLAQGPPEQTLRVVITRGEGEVDLDPTRTYENNLIIIAWPRPPNPSWWQERGVEVVVSTQARRPRVPAVKSGNTLSNVMAYGQAKRRGAFEALMLNEKGQLTEATTSNLWIVCDGVILTPPEEEGLLAGITRQVLIERATQAQLVLQQAPLTLEHLHMAQECFLTSTSRFVVPVVKVEGRAVGTGCPGPVAKRVIELFAQEVQEFRRF